MDDLEAKVVARLGDDTHVYPGHGDDTVLGNERPHLQEWRERAAAPRLHRARRLGPDPLPAVLDAAGLRAVADRLRPGGDDTLSRSYGLTFDHGDPGRDDGVEEVRGGRRLVLVCAAAHGGEPATVVVTTLVPGRVPQVSAAPPDLPRG